jgi:MFS family permease
MVPFLLALVWGGQTYPWFSPEVVGLFATAAVGLSLFIWAEHHAIEPILPLDLFRNRIFAVSAVAVFLQGVGMFGSILFAPLFIQGVIGSSATNSGLVLTPMSLAMIIASIISGQLLSRWGRYRIIAVVSMVIMAVGMYLMSQMTVTTTESEAVRNMVIVGVGLGGGMALYAVVVQNAFPYARLGVVTSGIQFFRSIGGTVGVAVMGSIMATRLTQYLTTSLPPQMRAMIPADQLTSATGAQALLNPEAMARAGNRLASLGPAGQLLLGQVQIALKGALAAALHDVFLTGFAVVLAATAVVFFLEEIPLRKTHGETPVLKQHHPAPEPKTGGG